MKPIKTTLAVLKTYTKGDIAINLFAVAIFALMMIKMIVFPYGMFHMGESNIYTEGMISDKGIQNVNPLFIEYNEADREISKLVFSGLLKYDIEKREIVEDMARVTINEAKTKYTLTLKENLKWHDGKPITAEDAYFTFHDIIQDKSFPNEILKVNFQGVKITQDTKRSISFELEKPNAFFISNLTTGILPKHILKDVDPFDLLINKFNKSPIGSGPYMIDSPVREFKDGRMQITLKQNPNYYAEKPEITIIRFVVFKDIEKLIEGIDVINGVVKLNGEEQKRLQNIKRLTFIPYELPQYIAIFMNMESEFLKDNVNVRTSLQKAINKEELLNSFLDKKAIDTPLLELDQTDWLYKYSLDEAKKAMKEGGYVYAEDDVEQTGFRYNDEGQALELNMIVRAYEDMTNNAAETYETVSYLIQSWAKLGINVKVEYLTQSEFNNRIMTRNYDLLLVGQNLGYNLDTYSYWHSTQANPMGLNLSNYKSFNVDSTIEKIRGTFDKDKQKELLHDLATQIKTDIPAIFLWRPVYYYATDKKVSGINLKGVVFPSDRLDKIAKWRFTTKENDKESTKK